MKYTNREKSVIKHGSANERLWYKKALYERTCLERALLQKTLTINVKEFTQTPNNMVSLLKKAVLIFILFKNKNKNHVAINSATNLGLKLGNKTLHLLKSNPKIGFLIVGTVLGYRYLVMPKEKKDSSL